MFVSSLTFEEAIWAVVKMRLRMGRATLTIAEGANPQQTAAKVAEILQNMDGQTWDLLEHHDDLRLAEEVQLNPTSRTKYDPVNWFLEHPQRSNVVLITNGDALRDVDVEFLWRALFRAMDKAPTVILVGGVGLGAWVQQQPATPTEALPIIYDTPESA